MFSATTTETSLADSVTMALIASSTSMVEPGRRPSLVGGWLARMSRHGQRAYRGASGRARAARTADRGVITLVIEAGMRGSSMFSPCRTLPVLASTTMEAARGLYPPPLGLALRRAASAGEATATATDAAIPIRAHVFRRPTQTEIHAAKFPVSFGFQALAPRLLKGIVAGATHVLTVRGCGYGGVNGSEVERCDYCALHNLS